MFYTYVVTFPAEIRLPRMHAAEMSTEPDPEQIRSPATFFRSGFGSGFEFLGKTGAGSGFSMYGIIYIECTYILHSYSKNIRLKPLHSLFHPNGIFKRKTYSNRILFE